MPELQNEAVLMEKTETNTLFSEVCDIIRSVPVAPDSFLDIDVMLDRLDEIARTYDRDFERVRELEDLMLGEHDDAFGARLTDIFVQWESGGGGPSLPALLFFALEKFEIDMSPAGAQSAFLAAALAEYPNDMQYHGNEHYRKVLFHAIRLIATHNRIHQGTDRILDESQIFVLLVASCIHDLGHTGGDNLRDGVYAPGKLEQHSFDLARPYLEAVGLDEETLGDIETIVFCTDITFFAGDNSPCVRMKKIYRYYFWQDEREDVSMMMMGKLRRFEDHPALVLMAMILHEADIATSAGLSYEQTIRETVNIMEERGITNAGPATVLAFLREQLGETMYTEAARQLYGKVMTDVIHRAEQDIAQGRDTFA